MKNSSTGYINAEKRTLAATLAALLSTGLFALSSSAAESPQLRHDVTQMVMIMDGPRDRKCTERKVVKTETIESRPDGTPSVERWTLDRCGKLVNYRVRFTPNSKGGTDFDVQLEK
jgi:hypothetical protein